MYRLTQVEQGTVLSQRIFKRRHSAQAISPLMRFEAFEGALFFAGRLSISNIVVLGYGRSYGELEGAMMVASGNGVWVAQLLRFRLPITVDLR